MLGLCLTQEEAKKKKSQNKLGKNGWVISDREFSRESKWYDTLDLNVQATKTILEARLDSGGHSISDELYTAKSRKSKREMLALAT